MRRRRLLDVGSIAQSFDPSNLLHKSLGDAMANSSDGDSPLIDRDLFPSLKQRSQLEVVLDDNVLRRLYSHARVSTRDRPAETVPRRLSAVQDGERGRVGRVGGDGGRRAEDGVDLGWVLRDGTGALGGWVAVEDRLAEDQVESSELSSSSERQ